MEVEATTTPRTDPTPFAHESHFAEQRRFDRSRIEAGHVANRIPALEHQHLQLVIDVSPVSVMALMSLMSAGTSNAKLKSISRRRFTLLMDQPKSGDVFIAASTMAG